ncbi:M20/M25/M40 family metallo-hydrolase [Treponema phagedenis]|uniref:M20/M25/M40 family metallo-hydrolase n=1 Tax=Treponema phagedenis TaxID=162 RepID=UPI0037099D66
MKKTPGAEDFAYLTQKVPGALAFIGTRNDAKGINAPHHNDCFNMDEDGLKLGTKLYAQFALDYLEDALKV